MSVQVEELEHNMAKLTVEVPAEDVEKALQAAYMKERNRFDVPGFRKGKVPRQMIERMYGPEIFYEEAINNMISDSYGDAYDESGLDIVSQPSLDVVQMEKGKPFIYTAEVAVKPEVTLGEYKGLKVDKVSTRVTQKEVDEEIEKERERNGRNVDVADRPVQDKDMITLDFEGFIDGEPFEGGKGEDYPLTIGSGSFIPGFEEQLIGAEIGKEMEVKVTFPADYQAEDLAGKDAVFKCTVKSIKEKELPDLDDEFASEVSECETLEDYKKEVKKKLKDQKEADKKQKIEDQAVDEAIENATMDIPQPMIDTQTDQLLDDFAQRLQQQGLTVDIYLQYTGMTEEQLTEELEKQAVKQIQTSLVLDAVVKAEDIQVSDERYDEEIQKMADSYQMDADSLKGYMGEREEQRMKDEIAIQDAISLIADSAVEG